MSGARSPRPRPAAAVMPTPLGTPPSIGSITNQSDPLNVRELRHRQLGFPGKRVNVAGSPAVGEQRDRQPHGTPARPTTPMGHLW
jgi:hypothetical protein